MPFAELSTAREVQQLAWPIPAYREGVPKTPSDRIPAVLRSDTHPLAAAEVELADAARRTSDFARGMVPSGHAVELEPGSLASDALSLAKHAQLVLLAAVRHERARGTSRSVLDGILDETATFKTSSLHKTTSEVSVWASEDLHNMLFDLDAWVHRHAETDDPQASRQPVTDAVERHRAGG